MKEFRASRQTSEPKTQELLLSLLPQSFASRAFLLPPHSPQNDAGLKQ
jgi:hypothetical protein